MAETNILRKAETAMAEYLSGLAITDNVYAGKGSPEKELPCVICVARQAGEDDPPGTGNKWVEMEVTTISAAAIQADMVDTVAATDTLAGAVADAVNDSGLAESLTTNGTDFSCLGVIFDGNSRDTDDETWSETISLRLYCVPAG